MNKAGKHFPFDSKISESSSTGEMSLNVDCSKFRLMTSSPWWWWWWWWWAVVVGRVGYARDEADAWGRTNLPSRAKMLQGGVASVS